MSGTESTLSVRRRRTSARYRPPPSERNHVLVPVGHRSTLFTEVLSIRVVLGEDSYLAREGIARALEALPDVEFLGAYDTLDSLRTAVGELEPDVVVTDIRMPPTETDEGIRFAAELRS